MARKVCINCKYFYEGEHCPICKGNQAADSWQGRVLVVDANKSIVAKKLGLTMKGEYAIKVR